MFYYVLYGHTVIWRLDVEGYVTLDAHPVALIDQLLRQYNVEIVERTFLRDNATSYVACIYRFWYGYSRSLDD